jgi:predicted ArsR family transcriptional regulator
MPREHRIEQPSLPGKVHSLGGHPAEPVDVPLGMSGTVLGDPSRLTHGTTLTGLAYRSGGVALFNTMRLVFMATSVETAMVTHHGSTAMSPVTGVLALGGFKQGHPVSGRAALNHHQVLASASRMAVLDLLRLRAQPLGVGEVALHVGLHLNTVRSHLDLLVDSGYAIRRTEAPSGPGRPRVVYEATAAPEGEGSYRLLAEILAQYVAANSERPGDAAVEAGRSWAGSAVRSWNGRQGKHKAGAPLLAEDAVITQVVRMLGDIGFAPELSADGTSIYLHRCPFRELAQSQPDVVCGAHLGMIQGALAEIGAPVAATRLIPFVEPGLCVTTLTRLPGQPAEAVSPAGAGPPDGPGRR